MIVIIGKIGKIKILRFYILFASFALTLQHSREKIQALKKCVNPILHYPIFPNINIFEYPIKNQSRGDKAQVYLIPSEGGKRSGILAISK